MHIRIDMRKKVKKSLFFSIVILSCFPNGDYSMRKIPLLKKVSRFYFHKMRELLCIVSANV